MPAILRLKGDGFTPFSMVLERLAGRAGDASPAFDKMADVFAASMRHQFDKAGGHTGPRWAPLTPQYAAQKQRTHPGRPLLVRDGGLRDDLTSRPLAVEHITSKRMIVGTSRDYARYHQDGTGVMVARKLIGTPTAQERKRYASILHEHIIEGANA